MARSFLSHSPAQLFSEAQLRVSFSYLYKYLNRERKRHTEACSVRTFHYIRLAGFGNVLRLKWAKTLSNHSMISCLTVEDEELAEPVDSCRSTSAFQILMPRKQQYLIQNGALLKQARCCAMTYQEWNESK